MPCALILVLLAAAARALYCEDAKASLPVPSPIRYPESQPLVFFHISKCGGTMMCALAKHAGAATNQKGANCKVDYPIKHANTVNISCCPPQRTLTSKGLECYQIVRERYHQYFRLANMSGYDYFSFETGNQGQVRVRLAVFLQPLNYYFTTLREPLRHRISSFNFFNRKNLSFAQWIAPRTPTGKGGGGRIFIDELFTRSFSDAQPDAVLTPRDLDTAVSTLAALNLVLLLPEHGMCTNFHNLLCSRLQWDAFCNMDPAQPVKTTRPTRVSRALSSADTDMIKSLIVWDTKLFAKVIADGITPCRSDIKTPA
jgi:hypothetical protein